MKIIIQENLTNAENAKINNCSISSIKRFKKKNNLKNRYKINFEKYLNLKSKYPDYDNIKLSKLLDVSVATISSFHRRSNQKSGFKRIYEHFTDFEKSILVGTLLGDSWLRCESKTSGRGGFLHKESNKDYVLFKYGLLKKHCLKPTYRVIKTNGENQWLVRLKSNPYLKNLWENLYTNKGRRITHSLLKNFTNLSLSLYYQDDGHKKIVGNWYGYTIAMYAYSDESVNIFRQFLKEKWEISTSFHNGILLVLRDSRDIFRNLVSPYIFGSMLYKL